MRIAASATSVAENGAATTFTITCAQTGASATAISFTVGGTASLGTDYTLNSNAAGYSLSGSSGSIQCSTSNPTPTITLTPLRDYSNTEGSESVTLSLVDVSSGSKAYWLDTARGGATSATTSITDVQTVVSKGAWGGT